MEKPASAVTIDVIKKKAERQSLQEMMNRRTELTTQKAEIEEELKVTNEAILAILTKHDVKTMAVEDEAGQVWTFTVMRGANTSLNKQMLITKGVDPAIIAECTKVTEYTTLQAKRIVAKDGPSQE